MKKLTKRFLKKIDNLTDKNCHSECVLEVAKYFKKKEFIDSFQSILKEHIKTGYLTYELSIKRSEETTKMFNEILNEYGEEIVKEIKSCM